MNSQNKEHSAQGRYSALIECLPGAFFEVDSRGDFTLTSKGAEELLGWCEEVVLGKRLAKKVPKEELYKLLVIFNQAAREGKGHGRIGVMREDSENISASLSVIPVLEDREITGFQCVITAHESMIQDRDARVEELIQPLFYELSSSLTIAKGSLELAAKDKSHARGQFLEMGRSALIRQHRVLMNLTDAFKLHRMEEELYKGEMDLKDTVHSVAKELKETYTRRGLEIKIALPRNLPIVTADAEKIRNVLYTILDYALMLWKNRGAIVISGEKRGGFVEICVGCRGESKDVTTEPASMSIDGLPFLPHGGIQVGLQIAEKIIEAHGGRFTNKKEDGAICFTLPVVTK